MAGQSNLISSEPYILTDDEAATVIENELISAKKFMLWRWADKGASKGFIEQKLAAYDWHSMIDFEAVLLRANSAKHYEIWQKGQRQKEIAAELQRQKELELTWTASQIFKLIRWTSEVENKKTLIQTDHTLKLIKAVCFFLSRDERWTTELGFDSGKGLIVRGVSGLGKSYVFDCAKTNGLNPVSIFSMIEIVDEIKREGVYVLRSSKIIYLDDVGTEETPVNYYGTKINWFKDFIELYYSQKKPFNQLVISTNNSFQQIEEKYGFRVRSRMKDMFNVLDVTGEDLRK